MRMHNSDLSSDGVIENETDKKLILKIGSHTQDSKN